MTPTAVDTKVNATIAQKEWASRPPDQRFWTLDDMLVRARKMHAEAVVRPAFVPDLRVEANDGDVLLTGRSGATASLTHWSFGQLSTLAGAPASYLRKLPATLAVQNLNHGLKAKSAEPGMDEKKFSMLFRKNGDFKLRSLSTEDYTRIWNDNLIDELANRIGNEWAPPPGWVPFNNEHADMPTRKATAEDAALSLAVREGDIIAPSGLYLSDEDMFIFMVSKDKVIKDGTAEGLRRGFILQNTEVAGRASFKLLAFLFRGACGNHLLWDVGAAKEIRLRHVGDADDRALQGIEAKLVKYAESSATETEERIHVLRNTKIADLAEGVLEFAFGKKIGLSKSKAQDALDAVVPEVDGDPLTFWGFAQGITRLSQKETSAFERTSLDRVAAKVLETPF